MAGQRQADGSYQWELSIPPESVVALLSAVCVDMGDPNSHFLGHLLWGPKSWCVRFEGSRFRLWRFTGNMYGLPQGTIVATKSGSRVELGPDDSEQQVTLRHLWGLFPVFGLVPAVALVFALGPYLSIWFTLAGALAFAGWFAFGFGWLAPWMARRAYTDFMDELFEDYLLQRGAARKVCSLPARP